MTVPRRSGLRLDDRGVSLVELLVVMVIIGILAGIAIPTVIKQRQRAEATVVESDISLLGKEIAAYYVDRSALLTVSLSAGVATVSDGAGFSAAVRLSPDTVSPRTTGYTNVIAYQSGTNCRPAIAWVVGLSNASSSAATWYYSAQGGLASSPPSLSSACT